MSNKIKFTVTVLSEDTRKPKVEEVDWERGTRLKRGFDKVIEVDASLLKAGFEKRRGEGIIWNENRLDSVLKRKVCNSYPQVLLKSDGVDVKDGRHRIGVAAIRGQRIDVAVPNGQVERLKHLLQGRDIGI